MTCSEEVVVDGQCLKGVCVITNKYSSMVIHIKIPYTSPYVILLDHVCCLNLSSSLLQNFECLKSLGTAYVHIFTTSIQEWGFKGPNLHGHVRILRTRIKTPQYQFRQQTVANQRQCAYKNAF